MKKGIVVRAFSKSSDFLGDSSFLSSLEDYREVFAKAADQGFEGVQIYTEISEGFLCLETPESTLKEIANIARDRGIQIPSLEIAPLQYSFTSDDPEERERGKKVVAKALYMARLLGTKGVLVIPGYVGLPWEKGGGNPVDYEQAYLRTSDALKHLAPVAEETEVSIYLENIWNLFLLSPLEMRGLIDEVGSDRVGVLLDTGNVIQYGFPEQWIRILGHRIQEVHLKDFRRSVGTVDGFVPLLAGDVNWPKVMDALREIQFEGYLIPEVFPYDSYGDTMLAHVSATVDRLL
ncbi:MAG: sugar phosphate isomerase/epimerase, partial [Candidatus Omnitrophica bacterium]|nr:sugar phosphate isomerase/epimerase [Candidatus Omnitrophota bacterium]